MSTPMQHKPSRIAIAVSGAALALSLCDAAQAQTAGCTLTAQVSPPGQTLTCKDGLTIRLEPGSAFSLIDRNRDGLPEGAKLDAKGALIELPPGRGGFQVRTPHAIAAVRGTVWAVDVKADQTDVFVERGSVGVRRPGGSAVTLAPGDGVDVKPGGGPLKVTRWGAPRVAALLARFGR